MGGRGSSSSLYKMPSISKGDKVSVSIEVKVEVHANTERKTWVVHVVVNDVDTPYTFDSRAKAESWKDSMERKAKTMRGQ